MSLAGAPGSRCTGLLGPCVPLLAALVLCSGVLCGGCRSSVALSGSGTSAPTDEAGAGRLAEGTSSAQSSSTFDGGRDPLDAARPNSGAGLTQGGDSGADGTQRVGADSCPPGSPRAFDRVRFYPAKGNSQALVGGVFQGSNTSPTNDFVDLIKIAQAPHEGAFSELKFPNLQVYRYIKYASPSGSHGAIAELEFYHGDVRLQGAGFGTASLNSGGGYTLALDGDPSTAFNGSLADGNYIGIDIGEGSVVATPTFTPAAGALTKTTNVGIASPTVGAKIRYTTDGSTPSATVGALYGMPIEVSTGRTVLKAVASADCLFDSQVAEASYTVGSAVGQAAATKGLKSYHLGNSLTDMINPWLKPIADSTGVEHTYARWTIPGTTIGWLASHKKDGFGTPDGAQDFDAFVPSYSPIDHLTVQPFADPTFKQEGGAAIDLYNAVLAKSPNVQLWIYAQWASTKDWAKDWLTTGAHWTPPRAEPLEPTSWEDATQKQLLYHEAFRQYVDDNAAGKRVLIVPGGSALLALKREIEAGAVPGISDFFGFAFADDLHLQKPVQYLVALVFYACLYGQSPEGRVTAEGTGLTDAQAKIFQRIAWEVTRAYPWSGVGAP